MPAPLPAPALLQLAKQPPRSSLLPSPPFPSFCNPPFQLPPSTSSSSSHPAPIYSHPLQTLPNANPRATCRFPFTPLALQKLAKQVFRPTLRHHPTFPSCCNPTYQLSPSTACQAAPSPQSNPIHCTHPHCQVPPSSGSPSNHRPNLLSPPVCFPYCHSPFQLPFAGS